MVSVIALTGIEKKDNTNNLLHKSVWLTGDK